MDLSQYKQLIELHIDDILETEKKNAPTKEAKTLIGHLKKTILAGGKRFRPLLMLSVYQAYEGKTTKQLLNLAAAVELFHQGLLIHDDVIDQDLLRHGKTNLVGLYDQDKNYTTSNIPVTMGILAGDLLLNLTNQLILRDQTLTAKPKQELVDQISLSLSRVIYGQQLDSLNTGGRLDNISTKQQIKIYQLKTAEYTTLLPVRLAAKLLTLNILEVSKLENYAQALGIYYQLRDDYLDYHDKDRPTLKDYREGKVTSPYIDLLEQTTNDQVTFIEQHFGDKNINKANLNRVRKIIANSNAAQVSQKKINSYYQKALDYIDQLGVSKDAKANLAQFQSRLKI